MLAPTFWRRPHVPDIIKLLLAPIIGALLAFLLMFGLIWSQTQTPEQNPASQPILTYGD